MLNEIKVKVKVEFDEETEEMLRRIVRDEIEKTKRFTHITETGVYTGIIHADQIVWGEEPWPQPEA